MTEYVHPQAWELNHFICMTWMWDAFECFFSLNHVVLACFPHSVCGNSSIAVLNLPSLAPGASLEGVDQGRRGWILI